MRKTQTFQRFFFFVCVLGRRNSWSSMMCREQNQKFCKYFCRPPTLKDLILWRRLMSGHRKCRPRPDFFVCSFVTCSQPISPPPPPSRFILGPNWSTNSPNGRRRALAIPQSGTAVALTDWTRMEAEAGRPESHLEWESPPPPPAHSHPVAAGLVAANDRVPPGSFAKLWVS